ncbi:MAG: helix-turn-helix domain-containing protein, partial [Pseudomonas sp.]|nr:helix-turn-helix domain-containing protein [Pseudomonas sp.]
RQLSSCLRYAAALAEDGIIDVDCLPTELQQLHLPVEEPARVAEDNLAGRLENDEARHLHAALREHRWNISAVADAFGVARSTLYRKMKKYGIVQPNELF